MQLTDLEDKIRELYKFYVHKSNERERERDCEVENFGQDQTIESVNSIQKWVRVCVCATDDLLCIKRDLLQNGIL